MEDGASKTKTTRGKTGGGADHRDAMTGMALLAYLGHCELQDSPIWKTVKRGIDFLTSTLPDKLSNYDNSGKFLGLKGSAIMVLVHPIRTCTLRSLHDDENTQA